MQELLLLYAKNVHFTVMENYTHKRTVLQRVHH